MKAPAVPLAAFVIWLSITSVLHAQSSIDSGRHRSSLSVELGLSRNFHGGGFKVFDMCDCPPLYGSGSAWGYSAGVVVEFGLGRSFSLLTRIAFESRPGDFQLEPRDTSFAAGTTLNAHVGYQLISLASLYKMNFLALGDDGMLSVAGGPMASFVVQVTMKQWRAVERGEQVTYNEEFLANAAFFAIQGGVIADVRVANKLYLSPGIYYTHGLTEVIKNSDWTLTALDLRMGILLRF